MKFHRLVFFLSVFAIVRLFSPGTVAAFFTSALTLIPFIVIHGMPKHMHSISSLLFRLILMIAAAVLITFAFAYSIDLTMKQGAQFVFREGLVTSYGMIFHVGFYGGMFLFVTILYWLTIIFTKKLGEINNV